MSKTDNTIFILVFFTLLLMAVFILVTGVYYMFTEEKKESVEKIVVRYKDGCVVDSTVYMIK